MDSLIQLAEEEPEFVALLLEFVEKASRIEVTRLVRQLEEEMQNALKLARAA